MRLRFDDYVLDSARRELWCGSEPVAIEPQVFDLLTYLAQNPDRVVCRNELLQAIWDGRIVSDSTIANRINAARRAIGDAGDRQRLIRTVPRRGFRFIGPVSKLEAELVNTAQPPVSRRHLVLSACAGAAGILLTAMTAVFLLPSGTRPSIYMVSGRSLPDTKPGGLPRLPIVILPFAALGGGADQNNAAAGITEMLTGQFTRYTDLRVTSRQTATAYSQKLIDAKQIGRELGVRYIVDGSVEQGGNQIRVTARLANAQTGTYLWADRYDHVSGNLLDVEDEIVGRTVNGVRRALTLSEGERGQGDGADAAGLVWRGSALAINANSSKGEADAAELFTHALQMSPSLVPARFHLAGALAGSAHGLFSANDTEKLQRASELIDQAMVAWPADSATHYVKGQVLRVQGHCDRAIPEFERAIAINRYSTSAYMRLAYCKFMTGMFDQVMPIEERAMRYDPMGLGFAEYYRRIGMAEMLQSHPAQAVYWLEKSRDAEQARPARGVYETYSELAAAYALNGDIQSAAEALALARESGEYPTSLAQFRRQWPLYANPGLRAIADATYFKGLHSAGLSEE